MNITRRALFESIVVSESAARNLAGVNQSSREALEQGHFLLGGHQAPIQLALEPLPGWFTTVNFRYSALAIFKTGTSWSALFQKVKNLS